MELGRARSSRLTERTFEVAAVTQSFEEIEQEDLSRILCSYIGPPGTYFEGGCERTSAKGSSLCSMHKHRRFKKQDMDHAPRRKPIYVPFCEYVGPQGTAFERGCFNLRSGSSRLCAGHQDRKYGRNRVSMDAPFQKGQSRCNTENCEEMVWGKNLCRRHYSIIYSKKYYLNNREKILAKSSQYQKENKDKYKEYKRRYRAKKKIGKINSGSAS